MKAQKRKLLNEPIRSPSPDVINRSIITNTKSPVNDVKDYLRIRQMSNSPKSITSAFHNISKFTTNQHQQIKRLKKIIQDLQNKNSFLEKYKGNHDQLIRKIESLNIEIAHLKQQLLRKERSFSNSQIETPRLSPHKIGDLSPKNQVPNFGTVIITQKPSISCGHPIPQNLNQNMILPSPITAENHILRDFNERIIKMSAQNKRLCNKLKQIKDQKDLLQIQNMRLKDQNEENKYNLNKSIGSLNFSQGSNNIQNLKLYFTEQSKRLLQSHQRMTDGKINQLGSKINKIEETVNKLSENQIDRKPVIRNSSPFQFKTNISTVTRTNFLNDPQSINLPSYQVDMIQSKYTSPREIGCFNVQASPIRANDQDRNRLKNQNDRLSKKVIQLDVELKKTLLSLNDAQNKLKNIPTFNNTQNQSSLTRFYQQKSESLQSQIQTKISEIKFKQLTIKELQKRLDDSKNFIEKQMANYEKIIKQQKQKSSSYYQQIQSLNRKISQLNQIINNNNKQFQYLKVQIQQIRQGYQSQQYNFNKYLEMVLQIKSSITGQEIQNQLNEVQRKWQGFDQLQNQIMNIKQAYDLIIQNLKKNILEKEQKNLELEKDNNLYKQTIKFMNIQREQLQKVIKEYTLPIKSILSEEQLQRKISFHQSASKLKRQPCQIRDYVNRTVHKISQLEKQIDKTIKNYENSQEKPSRTITKKQQRYYNIASSNRTPNKADQNFRTTVKNASNSNNIHKVINLMPSSLSGSNTKLTNSQHNRNEQIYKNSQFKFQQQSYNDYDDSSLIQNQDSHLQQEQ